MWILHSFAAFSEFHLKHVKQMLTTRLTHHIHTPYYLYIQPRKSWHY